MNVAAGTAAATAANTTRRMSIQQAATLEIDVVAMLRRIIHDNPDMF
jgi:hypothetical protein